MQELIIEEAGAKKPNGVKKEEKKKERNIHVSWKILGLVYYQQQHHLIIVEKRECQTKTVREGKKK